MNRSRNNGKDKTGANESGFRTIVVPITNPKSTSGLIHLAWACAEADKGRIIAVHIVRGDPDAATETIRAIEPIVHALEESGCPVTFETRTATSAARGILDVAQENNADLLVLGLPERKRERVVLGTINENILATASCRVVIYQAANTNHHPRVIVPVDGTPHAQNACHIGALMAAYYDAEMIAMHAQDSYQPRWVGLGRIVESLEGLDSAVRVQRSLVIAGDPPAGVLARLQSEDVVVIGRSHRSILDRLLFGSFSGRILEQSPCPVILVSDGAARTQSVTLRLLSRFWLRLTPAEQDDVERQAFTLSAANLDYFVLIAIAAMLAALGLLSNSAAVIIGAMLVAPFMQPCIGFAVGITTGHFSLIRRALIALVTGVPVALMMAMLCGLLIGARVPTAEMLARGNPTVIDALIAFASGMIGAYGTARKEIPAALAGVAIAAALMPPLCTVGLGMSTGYTELALRAGLLFFTNIVCIALGAWAVFLLLGMRPAFRDAQGRRSYIPLVMITLFMLPTTLLLLNLSTETNRLHAVERRLEALFPEAEIQQVELRQGTPLIIQARISTSALITRQQVAQSESALQEQFDVPLRLEIVLERVIMAPP